MAAQLEQMLDPKDDRQRGGDQEQVIEVIMQERGSKMGLQNPAIQAVQKQRRITQTIRQIPKRLPPHNVNKTRPVPTASANFNRNIMVATLLV